ncbi:MAG: hypothetical protein ACOY4W_05500, partial [Thermodesulfobacteriota bacterium]
NILNNKTNAIIPPGGANGAKSLRNRYPSPCVNSRLTGISGIAADKGSNLPSDLKQVALIASPSDRDKGYMSIEYSFANEESCAAEIAAQEDGAL